MEQQLLDHIENNLSFLKQKKLLIAVSGGVDSMVLLHLLASLGLEIAAAHCNFQLRGCESDADEAFVKARVAQLEIKGYFIKFSTSSYAIDNRLSIQQAARLLRYEWFEELLTVKKFDYVLTAHHLDDSLETFLINFTRGTGIEGLTGIPMVNGKIVRPLLIFSRECIEKYALEHKVLWREDSSNASDKYFRNKIRHHVVPVLKLLNPSLLPSFTQTIRHLSQTQYIATVQLKEQWERVSSKQQGTILLDINAIKQLVNYSFYLYAWLQPYGFTAWEAIEDVLNGQSGKQVFSANYRLINHRTHLLLTLKTEFEAQPEFVINGLDFAKESPVFLSFCDQSYLKESSKSVIFVNKEKLKFPLIVRKWQKGDYFYPFGMQGKKKISKYFKDEKFSLVDKENTWLLCSNQEIMWVINHRADRRFLANKETNSIVSITYNHEKDI